MACCLFSTKPLPEPILAPYQLDPQKQPSTRLELKYHDFHPRKYIWKSRLAKCLPFSSGLNLLTHWGRVTHRCVSILSNIGSDNGLSPGRHQAIIWTNACILLIRPLGTNFSEILVEILTFSFMKMRFKVSSAKWRPFCLGLNVLSPWLNYRTKEVIMTWSKSKWLQD